MSLEKWQEYLDGHFSSLAESRVGSGFPIFALEHGLTDPELEEITSLLHTRLMGGLRLSPHWLLWAIYAAERGYTYSGDEYWRSFEENTPGWEYKDRYKLPGWFAKFQKAYNGVTPSGPWAEHFRIIAWPITHAVLPRYLQRQFAKALFDLRFLLAGLTSIEPATIGRMIAANVYYSSTRFEEFLQQEELVGRIVLALLHQDPSEGDEPLLPSTLERITNDLEQVRHARDWLRETSHVVTDRFKGISRGGFPRSYPSGLDPGGRYQEREQLPNIRPDLLLRYAGKDTWTLLIDIPSFKSIAALNADIRQFLKQTRCSLNGDDGKKPAGWVLSGNRRAALKSWPDPELPLVGFDKNQDAVNQLLDSECRMSAGPVWLFRVGRDGIAREIRGQIARPGFDYIIATLDGTAELCDGVRPCYIDCQGIQAIRITVPSEVPAEYIHWLRDCGIELARTIRVWPAGLPGRNWDGEGRSDWLTTETPCFCIVPDHPVDSYVFSLNQGTSTVVQAGTVGQPTFIQLPHLDVGMHLLTVKARRSTTLDGIANAPAHEGFVELRVRVPEPWMPRTTSHAGLIITGDPHDASLDIFWENQLNLSVLGPENHKVTITVSLEDGRGEEIFTRQVCVQEGLPISPDVWRTRFAEFLKREQCEWLYLDASTGKLIISGEELGEFSLQFEHEVLPIRWVLRHDQGKLILRLVDDTGQEDTDPKCRYFSMTEPAKMESPDLLNLLAGIEIEPPGGLFVTQFGNHRDRIIVSAGLTSGGLQGLGVTPDYSSVCYDPATLIKVFHILRHWRKARLAGFVANARRQQVVDGLLIAIYEALCGAKWARAEANFIAKPNTLRATNILQAGIDQRGGFPAVLLRDATSVESSIGAITSWYTNLARRYGVCRNAELCAFAIRLASQPHRLPQLFRDDLEESLENIKKRPVLLRGARFVALLCANHDSEARAAMPRWKNDY